MAVRTITTSIALDGETQFRKQIGEVNGALRNLKAELRYNEEAFKGQANTTEALTAKSGLLKQEIEQQEEKVKKLAQAVVDASKAYGDSNEKTDKWRRELTNAKTDLLKLQRELKDTEGYLDEAARSVDGCADSIDEFGRKAEDVKSPLDDFKDQFGKLKGAIVGSAVAGAIKETAGAILELEESTREYRQIMGTLEVSSAQAGYTTEETEEAYLHLYGVLGDAQTTATTLANLQAVGLAQEDLMGLIDQTVGAWGRYGDSIPVDGLAESINETIRAGQVTGTFADVLNWGSREGETFGVTLKENIEFTELSRKELEQLTEAQQAEYEARKEQYEAILDYNEGVQEATAAEDMFNIALENCQTQAERTDLVLRTLSEMGLAEAGQAWRDTNEDIVTANESQARMEAAMGRLGEAVAPFANGLRNTAAGAVEFFAGMVEGATDLVKGFFDWWDKFTNTDTSTVEKRRAEARGYTVEDTTTSEQTAKTQEMRVTSSMISQMAEIDSGGGASPGTANSSETINITVNSILDGKKVGESVTRYQRNQERAAGR